MILLSRAEEIIMLSIFKLKDNAYGVTIREQVFKDVGYFWPFGIIYKTLKKLDRKEFVKKSQSEPLSERGGRRRYFYKITAHGMSALEEIQKVNMSVWSGMPTIASTKKV